MPKTKYLLLDNTDLGDIFISNGMFSSSITTNGGIIGPSTPDILYNTDMIGYNTTVYGNTAVGITGTSGSLTNYYSIMGPFTFPSVGVWLVTLCAVCNAINNNQSSGVVNYLNIALSTQQNEPATGQASFKMTTNITHIIPASTSTNGYVTGVCNIPAVITSTTTSYYFNVQSRFSGMTSITTKPSECYCYLVRIA